MRKILLDCGAHLGESVDKFRSIIPDIADCAIFMFEPNPYLFKAITDNPKYDSCLKIAAAVSNRNGTQRLWGCTRDRASVGATLERSKADWDGISDTDCVDVTTIDLSDFIRKNFVVADHIVLKLDVEGAEYDVLERLLQCGMTQYIKKLYCEFHSKWMGPEFKIREDKLTASLTAAGSIPEFWE